MDYDKAKKAVQASKKRENYLLLRVAYDKVLVLPHKEGTAVLAAMEKAERMDREYNPQRVLPLERDEVRVSLMSAEEYDRYKIAALLNVTVEELAQYETPTVPA